MRGVGFIPTLWVTTALKQGLIPSSRAHSVLTVVADAVDADGRWCWLHIATIAARTGGTLSPSTVKRGLADLEKSGLIRRLTPSAARSFFTADLTSGRRAGDRLPEVIEVLIPATAYPAPTVEEINAVRAELGECPLTAATRPDFPWPSLAAAPGQSAPDAGSDRPADLCPEYLSPTDTSPSGPTSTTPSPSEPPRSVPSPRRTPEQHSSPPAPSPTALHALRLIPDAALLHPQADRRRLARRLDELTAQGVSRTDLDAAVIGAETADRPYAALLARLADPAAVRAWLERSLHHPPHLRSIPEDSVASPASDTAAAGPCPAHPSIRTEGSTGCPLCAAASSTDTGPNGRPFTTTPPAEQATALHGGRGLSTAARASIETVRARLSDLARAA